MLHAQMDRPKLLAFMLAEFEFTVRTLKVVRPDEWEIPGAYGQWSVKDTVAHLAAWHGRFIMWSETFAAGATPAMPEAGYTWDDLSELNRITRDRDRFLDAKRAEQRFIDSFAQIRSLVEGMPETHLFSSSAFGIAGVSMPDLVAHNTYFHYFHHVPKLRAWLVARGGVRHDA